MPVHQLREARRPGGRSGPDPMHRAQIRRTPMSDRAFTSGPIACGTRSLVPASRLIPSRRTCVHSLSLHRLRYRCSSVAVVRRCLVHESNPGVPRSAGYAVPLRQRCPASSGSDPVTSRRRRCRPTHMTARPGSSARGRKHLGAQPLPSGPGPFLSLSGSQTEAERQRSFPADPLPPDPPRSVGPGFVTAAPPGTRTHRPSAQGLPPAGPHPKPHRPSRRTP